MDRLAERSYLPPSSNFPQREGGPGSLSSSVAMSGYSQSTQSSTQSGPPSLDWDAQTLASSSTYTNGIHPFQNRDGEREILLNDPGRFGCWFSDLGCRQTFASCPDWIRHAMLYHLRGRSPPFLRCPFACHMRWSYSQDDNQDSCQQLYGHIVDAHSDGGICGIRGDWNLLQYLWNQNIIDQRQFQTLTSAADPGNYLLQSGGGTRRRHDQRSVPRYH